MRGMTTDRGPVHCLLAVMAVLLLSGCADDSQEDLARDRAARDARGKAEGVEQAIERELGTYRAEDYAHAVGQVDDVELMRVDGTQRNVGDGVTLIVRVHGRAPRRDDFGTPIGELDLPICYRYRYDRDGGGLRGEVDCPHGEPVPVARDPQLPADIIDALRDGLPTGPAATEATVQATVDRLTLPTGVRRQVAAGHGAIGVAISASRYDCVLARVADGKVEVWRPSRIQLAPGELSCSAGTAAAGAGRTSPH